MAFTTIPPIPLLPSFGYMAGSASAQALADNTSWISYVFYWPGGDLTKCAFRCTAASGSPVVTAQLFNTNAADFANPVDTGSAIGSAVDSATLVANTITTVSGIGQSSLAAGTYALRLIFKTGTSCSLLRYYVGGWQFGPITNSQFPYAVTVTTGGAQTLVLTTSGLAIAVGGSTFAPVLGLSTPAALTATSAFTSASSPNEYGLWFANPFPVSVRVCGFSFFQGSSARADLVASYYSGTLASPSADVTTTLDRDLAASQSASGYNFGPFGTKQTLASGASAGIGIRAGSAHNTTLYFAEFLTGNEVIMDALWGQGATYFTRIGGAGALTQTIFRTPLIVPWIDGVDGGAAGGATPASLSGGIHQ